jgi:protein tyrosine/serine phosphatase
VTAVDSRHLDWDGCLNARDLGGLRTVDGRVTRRGAVVRSDNPAYLTADGWTALHAYGVRTIVALRTLGADDEEPDARLRPPDVALVHVAVEELGDAEFAREWAESGLWCTPLYYRDALHRWPDRCAAAVAAVANAQPGGVVVSCGRGCDRTGLVTMLLLALVGVAADDIAADWALSVERLRPRDPDYEQTLTDLLAREHATLGSVFRDTLAAMDVETYLRDAGLTATELHALRARLLEPSVDTNPRAC